MCGRQMCLSSNHDFSGLRYQDGTEVKLSPPLHRGSQAVTAASPLTYLPPLAWNLTH